MKLAPIVALGGILALAACSDAPAGPTATAAPSLSVHGGGQVHVTSAADDGDGSLRAAVEAANADASIRLVVVRHGLGPLQLEAPIVYTGAQALAIHGAGLVVDGSGIAAAAPDMHAALVANGGGDLAIRDLTVRASTGNGILVDVPDARTGTIAVALDDVTVEASTLHGVVVNDQVDYFADPFTREAGGSPASVLVRVRRSRLLSNGFGGLDYDGLRVNEGGDGTLHLDLAHSRAEGNGADGIELDERGDGDVVAVVRHAGIVGNGFFTAADFDDGIDVDEMGAGHLIADFVHVAATGNAEQGVDLNENNLGDLRAAMRQVVAVGNAEEGVELEEDDDFEDFPLESWGGDIDARLMNVTTNGNGANDGDAGLKLREKFDGDLVARIVGATALDNAIGGIQLREGQGGRMDAELVRATTMRNAGAGVSLRGDGVVRIQALTAADNDGGEVVADAGVSVTRVP